MANIAVDPYYFQSRMRELSGQKELTTGRGLTQPELEAILNAELSQRYTAEQNRRQQRIQEKALDAQTKAQEDAAEAAKLGGYAQLGVAGAYVGSKVPAIVEGGKSAYNWVTGATPAISPANTPLVDTATGVTTTGYGGMSGPQPAITDVNGFMVNTPTANTTGVTSSTGTAGTAGSTAFNYAAPVAIAYGLSESMKNEQGEYILANWWDEFAGLGDAKGKGFVNDPVGWMDEKWNLEEFEESSGIPGLDKDLNSLGDIWDKWF